MLPPLISPPVAAQGALKQCQVISLNAARENRDRDLAPYSTHYSTMPFYNAGG